METKKKKPTEATSAIPFEEQMTRRQSAPQPTPQSEAVRMAAAQQVAQMTTPPAGAIDGFKALAQVIGREQIQKAQLTLQKYKEGKHNLEQRIVENEQWYKLRHWECMRKEKENIRILVVSRAGVEPAIPPASKWRLPILTYHDIFNQESLVF